MKLDIPVLERSGKDDTRICARPPTPQLPGVVLWDPNSSGAVAIISAARIAATRLLPTLIWLSAFFVKDSHKGDR